MGRRELKESAWFPGSFYVRDVPVIMIALVISRLLFHA